MPPPTRRWSVAAAALGLACMLAGCKHSTPATSSEGSATTTAATTTAAAPPAQPVDPATAGTITGEVHFSGKAPARMPIDMSMDPACAMSATPNETEQYVVSKSGGLANVYIYIKAGAPASSAPTGAQPVVLDQKGCRYIPHVIAVQQGGSVLVKNSDPTMHNVHTIPTESGNASVDLSETPMGAPQTETFHQPETMLPVRCNNHPWMEAFINVAPNAYYAVTDADGRFTLPAVPPGTYTLAAVHEKLGEQDLQITVAPKATAKASFTFSAK